MALWRVTLREFRADTKTRYVEAERVDTAITMAMDSLKIKHPHEAAAEWIGDEAIRQGRQS